MKMQATELSIIIPVRNIEREISGILSSAAAQVAGREAEFIVTDMGSEDRTVLEAVQFIKEHQLRGFVIQNGNTPVAAALNTGIQKAGGDYLTFLFARRLYLDYLESYWETAARFSADLVFGCSGEEELHSAERRMISKAIRQDTGADCIKKMIRGGLRVDIAAILVRRKFLFDQEIRFSDGCRYGYAEEFVMRCLLSDPAAAQAAVLLRRDAAHELRRGKQAPVGRHIFQRVDAMLRILDLIRLSDARDAELAALFEQEKLPQSVLECVDILLKEGTGPAAVHRSLRAAGYDKLLQSGRRADRSLRRRVFLWKTFPWLYRVK